jgi:ribosomal protein S18 acetylase RimI-like enzyme
MTPPAAPPRPASPSLRTDVLSSDPAAIRRIVASTGFFRPAEVDVAVELADERLARGDASGYHFVLLDERPAIDEDQTGPRAHPPEALLGYACFGPIACTVDSFDLYWIAVDAAHQGRGLGRRLMHEAEARIRALGGKRIYIETSSQPLYEPTRRFYQASGYTEQARLPDFYTAGDDKIIYCRRL